MVGKNPYRVLASFTYDHKERPLRSGRVANQPPMTDTGSDHDSSDDEMPRKKSKLSEVFKVPITPKRNATKSPTPPTPPTPPTTSSVASEETEPRATPEIGKGKGRKGASAFLKGSPTQQAIWKAQENIEILEGYLSCNPVCFLLHSFFKKIRSGLRLFI